GTRGVSILLYVNFTLGLAGYATDVAAWQDAKRAGRHRRMHANEATQMTACAPARTLCRGVDLSLNEIAKVSQRAGTRSPPVPRATISPIRRAPSVLQPSADSHRRRTMSAFADRLERLARAVNSSSWDSSPKTML